MDEPSSSTETGSWVDNQDGVPDPSFGGEVVVSGASEPGGTEIEVKEGDGFEQELALGARIGSAEDRGWIARDGDGIAEEEEVSSSEDVASSELPIGARSTGGSGGETAIPVSVSDDQRVMTPLLITHQFDAASTDKSSDLPVFSLVTSTNDAESGGSAQSRAGDSHLPTTTVHVIPHDALPGQVAMEIHIPMQSQLMVSELISDGHQQKSDEEKVYIIQAGHVIPESRPEGGGLSDIITSPAAVDLSPKARNKKQRRKTLHQAEPKRRGLCCELCGKTFAQSSNLYRHLRHHNAERIPCDECSKTYSSPGTLKQHKESQHKDPLDPDFHRCKSCRKVFPTSIQLSKHRLSHTRSCLLCRKVLPDDKSFNRHMLTHTGEKKFQCDLCGHKFLRKCDLLRHRVIHSSERPFKCSVCSQSFKQKHVWREHEKSHNPSHSLTCQTCSKIFICVSAYRSHRKIHSRPKIHSCGKCDEKFGTGQELKFHIRGHWKEDHQDGAPIERNQCKECGAKFSHSSTLSTHMRTHSGEQVHSCATCEKKFTYYSSWRRHVMMHRGESNYACGKCGKGFSKRKYLVDHEKKNRCNGPWLWAQQMKQTEDQANECAERKVDLSQNHTEATPIVKESATIRPRDDSTPVAKLTKVTRNSPESSVQAMEDHGDRKAAVNCKDTFSDTMDSQDIVLEVKPFVCEHCGKMYKAKSGLQRHLKSHKNKKPFPCSYCNKAYSQRPILNEHLLMVHGMGEKKPTYPCTDCGKSFISTTRLEIHRRTHTGERPFNCRFCSKRFKEATSKRRHEVIHSGKKPYKCVICTRGFADKGNLRKHEATHGLEGGQGVATADGWHPFACADCGKTFKQLGYLQYHQRRMHQANGDTQLLSCESCNRKFTHVASLHNHMRSHREKPFKCEQCSSTFRKALMLERHEKACHEVQRCFACKVCGKVLTTKGNLQRHESAHFGVNRYQCTLCQTSFDQTGSLQKHLRTHEDAVKCDKCELLFSSRDACNEHREKNSCSISFGCEVCPRTFKAKNGLFMHMRVHKTQPAIPDTSNIEKKKVYICDVCHEQFVKKKKLLKHKRNHISSE